MIADFQKPLALDLVELHQVVNWGNASSALGIELICSGSGEGIP